ncbi:MAG TPA: hypothetical protein VHO07_07570 [Streptosporangiaceae bacterium]|nr:hypothetical protein [Streptosporangiaceae bacterium]
MRRGEVHELSVLERFRTDGLDFVKISAAEDGARATAEAIQAEAGVIYQGTLIGGGPGTALFGRPDFLVRADLLPAPDGEPRPGGIHYEVVHAKLVRDQIPGIIAAARRQPVTRVLDHTGYQAALRTKLLEEAREAQAAPHGQLASELADVLEVLNALGP